MNKNLIQYSLKLALIIASLSFVSLAYADDDSLTPLVQELLLSNSGDNQELGEWQWSVSGQYQDLETSKLSVIATELEYGVTSRLTLGIELPYSHIKLDHEQNVNGLGNIELSALYRLFDDDEQYFSVALERAINTSASAVEASQEDSWEVDFIYLKQLSNYQLKASLITEFEDDDSSHQVALAWLYQFEQFATAVELSWYDSFEIEQSEALEPENEESEQHAWQIAISAVWQYQQDHEIQLGIPIGISGEVADWGLALTWSVEWE